MRQRSSYGWLELIIGILLSALGIYSFFRPVDYLTTLIVVYGVAAFVTGIACSSASALCFCKERSKSPSMSHPSFCILSACCCLSCRAFERFCCIEKEKLLKFRRI